MKKYLAAGLVAFFAISLLTEAQQYERVDISALFREGESSYQDRDYGRAVAIFQEVQSLDPSYRSSEVQRYLQTSKGNLGVVGITADRHVPVGPEIRERPVIREQEFEELATAAQRVLLDAYAYLQDMEVRYSIPQFDMLSANSKLRMAKAAYEDSMFTETIRLSNMARLKVEEVVQKRQDVREPILGQIGESLVTLNLMDADLAQTLKQIYDLTGVNLVLGSGVAGKVTINVADMPLRRVLELITEANNLKYIQEDGVIKIMTVGEYATRADTIREQGRRVFSVVYGDAAAIAKTLRETFSLETIVYEPRTNSIVVDSLNPAVLEQMKDIISALDTPISQVLLEAKVVEVSLTDSKSYSIDWLLASRMISAIDSTLTGPRFGTPNFTPGDSSSIPGRFGFGITNTEVDMLIQALASQGEAKIVQSPRIMSLNGTTAVLDVTRNVPYLVATSQVTTDNQGRQTITTSSSIQQTNVGTVFEVTPIIQRNRNVFLSLSISDQSLVEIRRLTSVVGGEIFESDAPIISTRSTNQNVTLFDGQTLVIGGMIQQRESHSETGIPLLRRIPLLGYLFKQPSYQRETNEMLIFLTPRVITTFDDAERISEPEIKKLEFEITPGILQKF